jgi:PAS domain S-box-containing protein
MQRPIPNSNRYDLGSEDFIVSKTDLKGKITYCNKIFIQLAKYSEEELIGAPHSIIRHPDMPKIVFKLLWDAIEKKEEIFAYVKNLSKDGGYYWVFANVSASIDSRGNKVGYYSIRRKPSDEGVKVVSELYAKLLDLERNGGIAASGTYLNKLLEEKNLSYDELISSLQG